MRQRFVRQKTTMTRAGTSLKRSDFQEQQENNGKQDEEEDRILEKDFPSDDDNIPSLEREAVFHLGRGSRFVRIICFSSSIVFS